MSRFNPDFYRRYRPYYPESTFERLSESLVRRGFSEPFSIADIGCGTGHSVASVLRAGIQARIIGVDPDPGMLAVAREIAPQASYHEGTGEETGLPDHSFDAVIVGSAFHWMDPEKACREFARILRPRGVVRVFEYQFPKACELAELNEWVRRQFNLHWKAPGQTPRGDFNQVTDVFRRSQAFEELAEKRPPMILELSAEEVAGLILSQSRVLHYEASLSSDDERSHFRHVVLETLRVWMGHERARFDFKLSWVAFGLR